MGKIEASPVAPQNGTILIIDDEAANLAVVGKYLMDHGFQAVVAQNGEAGLELARQNQPSLILLDVLLPDIDGFAVCRRLKADERTWEIPVIFMTIVTKTEDKIRGFEAGGVDYITKPFEHQEVLARVSMHLRLRDLTRELEEAKQSLERRVAERTAELTQANVSLKKESAERKQAEETLRASEEKYRTLIQKIQAGVVVHGSDTGILTCNPMAQALLGLSEDQLLGKIAVDPAWYFFREDGTVMPSAEYPVNQVFATRQPLRDFVAGIHRPDKDDDVWVLVNADPVPGKEDEITQVIVTFIDITEHKRAEEKLQKNDTWLNEAQRIAHIGSWELDLLSNRLEWSDEIYRIFEINPHQFGASYESFLDLVHPEDREMVNRAYTDSVNNKTPYDLIHRLKFSDGRIKFVHERCETFYEEGKPIRSLGTVQDITERKQAGETLRGSERRLAEAQRIAHIGYWERDFEAGQIILSEEACRIFGLSPQEVPLSLEQWHQRWLKLIHPEDQPRTAQAAIDAVGNGPPYNVEYRVIRPGGEVRFIHSEARVTRDESGRARYMLGMMQDITERKLAEESLRRLNRELRAISNCNQILLRAVDEQTLLIDICRIICDEAGYRMAWVGYAEHDEAKTVRPVAWAGVEDGYLATANITWADTERGRGPTGIAIRTGASACIQDFTTDPKGLPWRENALRRGYRATIALPLKDENAVTFGILCIYSTEPNAFTPDETRLLEELAGDLAFGVSVLRTRAERKRAEEAQRESEKRYRIVADNTYDWEFWLSPDEQFLYNSPSCQRITGYTAEDFAREPGLLNRIIHPEDYERFMLHHQQVMEKKTPGEVEFRILRADGSVRYIGHVCQPVFDEQGSYLGKRGSNRDITERTRAEEALRASEERYRTLVEQAADGVFIADANGNYVDVNPSGCRMLGYSREQILKLNMRHLVPAPQQKAVPLRFNEMRSGKTVLSERNLIRQDGVLLPVEISGAMLADGRFLGIVRDITDRKQAEEEIRRLNQELEQRVLDRTAQLEAANKELEAFAYSVSHDLRAPLRHIDGFLELLRQRIEGALDDQSRHYMTTISNAAQRMGLLIDDLLAFSRMGRYEMSKTPVDLGALVREIIQEFTPETQSRSIHWRIADLPIVNGDRAMLRQVLVNLLSNALKFTRGRPQADIEIGCRVEEKESTIFIRDNGVGFDMAYAGKLFGVFQRLHRADEFEGTGIGLANVRRIIHRHGGRVWAEGEVDQGATFYFALPRPL